MLCSLTQLCVLIYRKFRRADGDGSGSSLPVDDATAEEEPEDSSLLGVFPILSRSGWQGYEKN